MAERKRNQTFQYLKAILILMVIDDHMSTRIGLLSSIFPYNSFYMPMFVFISGYFYREETVCNNIKHKIKHYLVPYLIWAVVGEAIAYVLMRCNIVNWYVNPFSVHSILCLITLDSLSPITGASWFVIMLFWVSIGYNILNMILRLGKKNMDYLFLAIIAIAGAFSLKLCMAGFCMAGYSSNLLGLFILRTTWYLQFYHMGRMFRAYWEDHVKSWRTHYTCSICVAVNTVLICILGEKINFYSTSIMGSFNSCWMPLITSATGTLFWYKLVQFLSDKLGRIRIIDFIAENTFTIMESHILFINIPNFYVYFQCLLGNERYADFPLSQFISSTWVRYNSNTRLIGFFCGLIGSLLVAYLIGKAKSKLANKIS